MIRTASQILAALLLCVGLAACKDSPAPSSSASGPAAAAPKGGSSKVSVEELAAQAKGFTVGSEMSVRRVFVFFDPQCQHCSAQWVAAKPLKSQARFIWIPVGILNPNSNIQGAAILAAADPIAAMDQHEASMTAQKGGITAQGDNTEQKASVVSNTALMSRYGFGGVPVIVGKHATTGELVIKEGSLPTGALAAALGLQAPTGN